jgi:hypothetical protein
MFLLALVGIVVCAELFLRVAAGSLPPAHEWYHPAAQRRAELLAGLNGSRRPDVVFLGSSSAAGGLDPNQFRRADPCRRNAFNAGTPGSAPRLWARWLDDAVLAHVHPEVAVIALTSRDLAVGGDNDAISAYDSSRAGRTDFLGRLDRRVAKWSYIVRYREMLRDPYGTFEALTGKRTADERRAGKLDARGYLTERTATEYHHALESHRALLSQYRIDPGEEAAIGRMIDDLRARGVLPVVVNLPVTDEWRTLHRGGTGTYDGYRATLRNLVTDHGARYVDLGPVTKREGDFIDPIHLAPPGAVLATNALARELGPSCQPGS